MFWTKKVVIGDGERGLVYRNRRFERVLVPGVYRWFDPMGRIEVRTFNIAAPEYAGHDVDALIVGLGDRLGETFVCADIGVDQVGLVLKNGKLEDVLPPGARRCRGVCRSVGEGVPRADDSSEAEQRRMPLATGSNPVRPPLDSSDG